MIHQYKNNGYNIVMDISSGSVHVVDDVVYDAVELLEPVRARAQADGYSGRCQSAGSGSAV